MSLEGASRVEPAWLPIEAVIEVNRAQVAVTSEPHSILNQGLLESACKRCENHWYYECEDDVVVLAVKLLLGIAQNHPFEQGNKRTAFVAAVMFLGLNGYEFIAEDTLGEPVLQLITGTMSEKEFTEDIFRPYAVSRDFA